VLDIHLQTETKDCFLSGNQGVVYTALFSTKNGKLCMRFGASFTRQWHFGSLKTQTFENAIQSACFFFLNETEEEKLPFIVVMSLFHTGPVCMSINTEFFFFFKRPTNMLPVKVRSCHVIIDVTILN